MDIFRKYIVEDGNLIIAKCTYHKQLSKDVSKVQGGGTWYKQDDKTIILDYQPSQAFGCADVRDLAMAVLKGNVYSNMFCTKSISQDFTFIYFTGTEYMNLSEVNIFLDDERDPRDHYNSYLKNISHGFGKEYYTHHWIVLKTYDEFVEHITTYGFPKRISFDNDLQQEMEGKDCLKWLVERCMDNNLPMPICKIHTANTARHDYMKDTIRNYTNYLNK